MNPNIFREIVKKSVKIEVKIEEDTIYAYVFTLNTVIGTDEPIPYIIKANSHRELYLKIFNRHISSMLSRFLRDNYEDKLIKKYIDSNGRIDNMDFFYMCQTEDFYDTWRQSIIEDKIYINNKICDFIDNIVNFGTHYYGIYITKMHDI